MNVEQKVKFYKSKPWLCLLPFTDTQIKSHDGKTVTWNPCCNLINYDSGTDAIDEIKESVLKKQKNSKCDTCYKIENTGGISERLRALVNSSQDKIDFLLNDSIDTTSVTEFYKSHMMMIMFSNRCNLACRMCSSGVSSYFNKVYGTGENLVYNLWEKEKNQIKKYFNEKINQLDSKNDLVYLQAMGGEPLMEPSFFEFLDWVEENKNLNKIKIQVTTNFTQPIYKKFIDTIEKSRGLELIMSIDSVGDNYSLVRHPSNFSIIEKNLEKLVELSKNKWKNKLSWIIQPVFYNNNIFYFGEFLDYWLNFEQINNIKVNIKPLHFYYPKYLSSEFLPLYIKRQLIDYLKSLSSHSLLETDNLKLWYNGTIETLESSKENYELFREYLSKTYEMDIKSGISTPEKNKKLFDLIKHD